MSEQGFLEVKNYERFQHYKDRNPPWIKLHVSTLDDYAFARLPDAQKWHLVGLWILASKCENAIPLDPEWIAKRIGSTEPLNVEALMGAGFISLERRKPGASKPQAKGSPRQRQRQRRDRSEESAVFHEAWSVYPKRPNNNRAEAWEAWQARVAQDESEAAMLAGTKAYAAWVAANHTEPKYVKQAATFYGPKRHYLNDYEIPALEVIPGGQQNEERYAFLVGEAQRLMDMDKYPDWPLYRDRYRRGEKPKVSRGTLRPAS